MFASAWDNDKLSDCSIQIWLLPEEEEAKTVVVETKKRKGSTTKDPRATKRRKKHTWTKSDMTAMKDTLQNFVSSHIVPTEAPAAPAPLDDDAASDDEPFAQIRASKAILAAYSGFFRDMWESKFKEATEGNVTMYAMNDSEAELIVQALKYCYTESLSDELTVPDLIHMFMVADKYQMAKLMTHTMVRLPKQMKTLQDACLIIDLIDTLPQITQDCKPVYIRAIECLGTHFKDMHKMWTTDDFVKLSLRAVCALFSVAGRNHLDKNFDEAMVYRAIQRWSATNSPSDALVTETLLIERLEPDFYFNVIAHDVTFSKLNVWPAWCKRYQMTWMNQYLCASFNRYHHLEEPKLQLGTRTVTLSTLTDGRLWHRGYLFKIVCLEQQDVCEISVEAKESGLDVASYHIEQQINGDYHVCLNDKQPRGTFNLRGRGDVLSLYF